ncbi:myrosinase 1-like isoform X2 [Euwallacea similis]|uniref:myrosinase 1-like isoform X2 n=1 Tax=Euwallacea similis TaxID=1736056 RepID=UPI00344B76DD
MRLLALILNLILTISAKTIKDYEENVTNKYFPETFKFGVATSAYQIEGGWDEDGKGESIWDRYLHENSSRSVNGDNGDVACDSYHKWREDVQIMAEMGVSVYRLSMAWPRILPDGTTNKINQPGVDYYLNIFKELKVHNIEPMVTLFHSDLPVHLDDLGGWLNPQIADYFAEYARVAYSLFGDYVKLWVTLNEPKSTCLIGYGDGNSPPALVLPGDGVYQCAKTQILAHAKAWRIYDEEFRAVQGGKVSLVLDSSWSEPASDFNLDESAAEKELDFELGWFASPIYLGEWPSIMIKEVGNRSQLEGLGFSRLPALTPAETLLINGSFDFFALNIDPLWPKSSMGWLYYAPFGIRKMVNHINEKYNPGEIFITENGWPDNTGILEDKDRIRYYKNYLSNILDAILEDGVNVVGYTAWSFMDNLEWASGFSQKMGLIHVDFESPNKTRSWKESGRYYQKVVQTRCLVDLCVD